MNRRDHCLLAGSGLVHETQKIAAELVWIEAYTEILYAQHAMNINQRSQIGMVQLAIRRFCRETP